MTGSFFIVLIAVFIKTGFGLECTQIPSASVFAGNTVYLPGPSDQLQIIPANFNCVYKINVPGNSTHGLSANVVIRNGLRGVNDYIRVVDVTGYVDVLNNKTHLKNTYSVIPGAEMTIQVVTRSVYMQSMLEITVEYMSAQIGPTIPMKTGAEMNYIDVASLRDGKSLYNSVTFVGTEPIHMSNAVQSTFNDCWDCFVIDGTIDNQTQIYRMMDFDSLAFTSKSNAITIVSSSDQFWGYVFNPKSEADKLFGIISLAVDGSVEENGASMRSFGGRPGAVQVVNFETNGIVMDRFDTDGNNCTAYVVHGPPNNSSKVLLDLSTPPKLPQSFDVKYFSVVAVAVNCNFLVYVRGRGNS